MRLPRLSYNTKNLTSDITAGTKTALVTIPDSLASAMLAGIGENVYNPCKAGILIRRCSK